jgi:hypothetical protein
MLEMDDDNSGSVSYPEFEAWWRKNGGDLEVHRALAFTVLLPDINLLLVRTVPYRTVPPPPYGQLCPLLALALATGLCH